MKKISIFILLFAVSTGIAAQSVPFVVRNVEPRALAVGSVAMENMAAINALSGKKLDISASYGLWAPENYSNSLIGFNGYGNIGKFSVGLFGRYNICKEYDIFDSNAKPLGVFNPNEFEIGASFAYAFAEKFALGARVNYISSILAEAAKGSAVGVDLSFAYKSKGLQLALAARNIGSEIKYGQQSYKLPSLAALGASYSISAFSAYLEADYMFSGSFMGGLGVEYTVIDIFTFRAGFHCGDEKSIPTFVSVGLGINYHGALINATYLPSLSNNGSALLVGLGYSF